MANERVHKIIRIKIIYMQNEIDVFLTVPLYVGLLLFSIWYNIYIFVMTEKKFAFFLCMLGYIWRCICLNI